MELMSLPVVMIENILSYLSYDEIARHRLVCKDFDVLCQRMLNRGFLVIERRHGLSLKSVKSQLPRRESERRYHPLARHCDILTSIETRISMLNMTYSKFIDHNICCFIPGKVIDEIQRVLHIVDKSVTPPRAHEVLQELRDISSMAIEHFDDKISPAFRKRLQEGNTIVTQQKILEAQGIGENAIELLGSSRWRQELWYVRRKSVMNARISVLLYKQHRKFNKKLTAYHRVIERQRGTIKALSVKQSDQDAAIADLKKRIEECDIKYSELTHTNQAVGGKAISGDACAGTATSSQPLRNFASQIKLDLSVLPIGTSKNLRGKVTPNIKPRNPKIRLPSICEEDPGEPPSKHPKLDKNTKTAKSSSEHPGPSTSRGLKPSSFQESLSELSSIAKTIKNLSKSIKISDTEKELSMLGKRKKVVSLLDETMCNDFLSKKQKLD